MKEKLDEIIKIANGHDDWNKNTKMRYAYIELGKLVHKDVDFFFSLYGKLGELNLNISELDKKMNTTDLKSAVTCKVSANMLKYIFDNIGIESEILKTCQSFDYVNHNGCIKKVTYIDDVPFIDGTLENVMENEDIMHVYHFFFICCRG